MSLTPRPKQKLADRKRQAQHHHHSKRYLNTYWPYIPMILVIIFGLSFNQYLNNKAKVLGTTANFSSNQLLTLTNQDRANNHLSGLSLNPKLEQAAQAKANDMVTNNYWSHISPSGKTPWTFIISSGYQFSSAGENLAYGFNTDNQINAAWMSSTEHRDNILSPTYKDVGFGIAESSNYIGQGPQVIVVAEYAAPLILGGTNTITTTNLASQSKPVSRFQLLTGVNAVLSEIIIAFIIGICVGYFIIRHSRKLKRKFTNGEDFLIHHPFLDVLIAMVIVIALLLGHRVGFI